MKRIYSKVMEYFVMFCMLVFLGIVFYIDIIQLIVGRDFRAGMEIVPIMLLSYMMLGMLFNVSMWYKLSDKSGYAIVITSVGLVVTAVVNILFLPKYSYHAAAWGHFLSYFTMLVISALLGNKYYPIPYSWGKITAIILFGLAILGVAMLIPTTLPTWLVFVIKSLLILIYVAVLAFTEYYKRKKVRV